MIYPLFPGFCLSASLLMIQKFILVPVIYLPLQKVMNRELKKVKKWLDANQLALNIEKTNLVIFHSPQRKIDDNIVIKFMRKRFLERHLSNS